MNTIPPAIQDLARRLIACEAARDVSDGPVGAAARTCNTLRTPLTKFAGVAGFQSLLTRALTLATVEIPRLASVRVMPDGSLEGFDAVGREHDAQQLGEAAGVVVAQLLGLLVTFIGEPLTQRLVNEAWPDETHPTVEGKS